MTTTLEIHEENLRRSTRDNVSRIGSSIIGTKLWYIVECKRELLLRNHLNVILPEESIFIECGLFIDKSIWDDDDCIVEY
jgi:hypothetical protein